VGAEYTVDSEIGYHVNDALKVSLSARDGLDNFPDEYLLHDTEVAGSKYPTTSPIGINSGFYYLKGVYTF
jgi:iron complex outermembrane receptor protein|tara:strand:+ start:5979 stop:6188 length:210 start_codon:yes stop_codon:yes gene_type:complete